MMDKKTWACALAALLCGPAPAFCGLDGLVKVRIKLQDSSSPAAAQKMSRSDELARVLLAAGFRKSVSPAEADQVPVLSYNAADWNRSSAKAQAEAARAELLKLWGSDVTIESYDSQAPQAGLRGPQPKAQARQPDFKALTATTLRLVPTTALQPGRQGEAYDNSRGRDDAVAVLRATVLPPASSVAAVKPAAPAAVQSPKPVQQKTASSRTLEAAPVPAEQPGSLYEELLVPIADEYGVSPDIIRAIVMAKSGYDVTRHGAGAHSLMGVSGGVAQAYGYKVKDLDIPSVNLRAGTRLMAALLKQFDGNLHRALAAYQVGPGAVIKSRGIPNDPAVKSFLAAFEKAYRGSNPKRSVQPVQAPEQSLVKEIKAEVQDAVVGLVDKARGNLRVARYRPLIDKMAALSGVDPKLMEAMVMVESRGDPNAVSGEGAVGLGQLMPETARMLGVKDPTDPAQNLKGMAKHLKYLLNKYHGNYVLAVAAYNAGEGRVDRVKRIPNIKETKDYVRKVMGNYEDLAGVTIDPSPYMPPVKRPVIAKNTVHPH